MSKYLKVDVTIEIPDNVEYDNVTDLIVEAIETLGCGMGGFWVPVDENGEEIHKTR